MSSKTSILEKSSISFVVNPFKAGATTSEDAQLLVINEADRPSWLCLIVVW